jgi:cobalt/nickel transport system ATP-binding protein
MSGHDGSGAGPHFDGSAAVFETSGVSFAYDGQGLALDHISMTVHPGERVAVLGSNGSGKSTLLKILDGLLFPVAGSVRVFGQPLTEQTLQDDGFNFGFRSRVAFVFQESDAQLFMPTVWEEVAFGPLQLGEDESQIRQRVDEVLDSLEIEALRDRAPHQLSGGEKRKVALASVLSLTPEAWLLDEPSAGLDPRTVSWLVEFLNSQARAKKTIIVATHDLAFARLVSDRVYVLDERHQGAASGLTRDVLADHDLLSKVNLIDPNHHRS